MSNGVQSHSAESAEAPAYSPARVVLWQGLCILMAVGFIWSCVAFEWPCRYLAFSRSETRWAQAGFLSAGLLTLGCLILLPVFRHWKQHRGRPVTVCSYCRKVHARDNDWEHFEVFFSTRRLAQFSHGVCPECGDRVMQDYRAGKEDAGAVAPAAFRT